MKQYRVGWLGLAALSLVLAPEALVHAPTLTFFPDEDRSRPHGGSPPIGANGEAESLAVPAYALTRSPSSPCGAPEAPSDPGPGAPFPTPVLVPGTDAGGLLVLLACLEEERGNRDDRGDLPTAEDAPGACSLAANAVWGPNAVFTQGVEGNPVRPPGRLDRARHAFLNSDTAFSSVAVHDPGPFARLAAFPALPVAGGIAFWTARGDPSRRSRGGHHPARGRLVEIGGTLAGREADPYSRPSFAAPGHSRDPNPDAGPLSFVPEFGPGVISFYGGDDPAETPASGAGCCPEPGTLALLALGVSGLAVLRQRPNHVS